MEHLQVMKWNQILQYFVKSFNGFPLAYASSQSVRNKGEEFTVWQTDLISSQKLILYVSDEQIALLYKKW